MPRSILLLASRETVPIRLSWQHVASVTFIYFLDLHQLDRVLLCSLLWTGAFFFVLSCAFSCVSKRFVRDFLRVSVIFRGLAKQLPCCFAIHQLRGLLDTPCTALRSYYASTFPFALSDSFPLGSAILASRLHNNYPVAVRVLCPRCWLLRVIASLLSWTGGLVSGATITLLLGFTCVACSTFADFHIVWEVVVAACVLHSVFCVLSCVPFLSWQNSHPCSY